MICAESYFPKIKEDFETYESFLMRPKTVATEIIVLTQPARNAECKGTASIEAGLPGGSCELIAVRSPRINVKYSFKIRADHFDQKPCLRFCSKAHVHINEESGLGLPARAVPTPHFHRVNSRGTIYAYQNSVLEDPEEKEKIISDPQLGANLFCQEMNLSSPGGGIVKLKILPAEFALSSEDPLDGATFPI
jgi:hypothetical protein